MTTEFKLPALVQSSLHGTHTAVTAKYLSPPIYILIEISEQHQPSLWTKQCPAQWAITCLKPLPDFSNSGITQELRPIGTNPDYGELEARILPGCNWFYNGDETPPGPYRSAKYE